MQGWHHYKHTSTSTSNSNNDALDVCKLVLGEPKLRLLVARCATISQMSQNSISKSAKRVH
jgi:hypothetical protein